MFDGHALSGFTLGAAGYGSEGFKFVCSELLDFELTR
jgi:hypothetical protein